MERHAAAWGLTIVRVYEEAMSAKAPGRPVFEEMLRDVEKGKAEGVIAWHPDRLARNSVDGGRVIYLLDTGKLRDLRFATFTFENNPQGKFMLSIIFGYSKYYVDSLSENVRRGMRAKVERGWLPNFAPAGYLNDRETGQIVPDPERFGAIQRIWRLVLTREETPGRIADRAAREWGLVTRKRKRIGGSPFTKSAIYKILKSPFYAGVIEWAGSTYPGKHEAMVTLSEFEEVQRILGRPGRPRRKTHDFPYRGLLRCGECGFAVTAENKRNRFGSRYTYYHCSWRRRDYNCTQPCIAADRLEEQFLRFAEEITLPEQFTDFELKRIDRDGIDEALAAEGQIRSLEARAADVDRQLANLKKLRIRDILDDDEFHEERQGLTRERLRLAQEIGRQGETRDRFEPVRDLVDFTRHLGLRMRDGAPDEKRLILEVTGSNPRLVDRELSIDVAKPFRRWSDSSTSVDLRAWVREVRTFVADPEAEKELGRVRRLMDAQRSKPQAGAKRKAA